MSPSIYLASQSPRRRQLLEQIGIAYTMLLPEASDPAPEDTPAALEALEAPLPQEAAEQYVQRVTQLKLQAASARLQRRAWRDAPILCADTTVSLHGRILGKPEDAQSAKDMLTQLSGTAHQVLTAVAVMRDGSVNSALSISEVQFAPISPTQMHAYLRSGEWQGKAGAYGIQGLAATMIASISGSYSGIMGLPLFETHQLLQPWLQANTP